MLLLLIGFLVLRLCQITAMNLPVPDQEAKDLETCNRVALLLSNEDPNGVKMLTQCKEAYLHYLQGGDMSNPPRKFGSASFVKAMMISKIPKRIRDLVREEVNYYAEEASKSWRSSKLHHQERNFFAPIICKAMDSQIFVVEYLDSHPGYGFALEQTQRFPLAMKVVGDGNCFYRAFMFGLIHYFHKHAGGSSNAVRGQVLSFLSEAGNEREEHLFGKHIVSDAGLDLIRTALENAPFLPMSYWHRLLNDHEASDAMVFALRVIVAAYGDNAEDKAFIAEDENEETNYHQYCQSKILPMGFWGGQIETSILSRVFQVSIGVTDLVSQRRLVSDDMAAHIQQTRDMELIYNGAHYDMFYLQ